jgi:hypothetical protein
MSYDHLNQWIVPSGWIGKSTNPATHECRYGFGFEEWFFNQRRFADEHGRLNCHFVYLEPFNRKTPPNHNNDLHLYTLQNNHPQRTNRFIVARINAGHWRFIDHHRYLKLRDLNLASIAEMKNEVNNAFERGLMRDGLSLTESLNRFENQLYCKDFFGNNSIHYRLWNIELLTDIKICNERITNQSSTNDQRILNYNRFGLLTR